MIPDNSPIAVGSKIRLETMSFDFIPLSYG